VVGPDINCCHSTVLFLNYLSIARTPIQSSIVQPGPYRPVGRLPVFRCRKRSYGHFKSDKNSRSCRQRPYRMNKSSIHAFTRRCVFDDFLFDRRCVDIFVHIICYQQMISINLSTHRIDLPVGNRDNRLSKPVERLVDLWGPGVRQGADKLTGVIHGMSKTINKTNSQY
jgi:hypothetical protein